MDNLDNLTKLYNEKYLAHQLDQEILRAQRYGRPVTVILFTVVVPEQYRRDMHYRVLKQLGALIKKYTRNIDTGGRLKEGVAVMLPETPPDGALVVALKIREQMENYKFTHPDLHEEFYTKLIYKVAAYPEHGQDRKDIMLYLNKTAVECPTEISQICKIIEISEESHTTPQHEALPPEIKKEEKAAEKKPAVKTEKPADKQPEAKAEKASEPKPKKAKKASKKASAKASASVVEKPANKEPKKK